MEALSGLATSHTRNVSRDMLPDTLDRDNTRLPLNFNHSSQFYFSKYLSPSRVLKKSDTYHTENPSYFRYKRLLMTFRENHPSTETVSTTIRVIECQSHVIQGVSKK